MTDLQPSQRMRDLGVVQHGAAILAEPARAFDLSAERDPLLTREREGRRAPVAAASGRRSVGWTTAGPVSAPFGPPPALPGLTL